MSTVALPAILDGKHLVQTLGFPLLLAIVFAETGLLVGFFLPGDSLLFAAGFAAAGGIPHVSTPPLVVVCLLMTVVAVAGAQTGFLIGRKAGPALFDRPDSRLFKRSYVDKTEQVLERYGPPKAIVLARFVPIVRTFLNPVLGIVGLSARTFLVWNAVGGVLWGTGVVLLGYFLGNVSFIGRNLEAFSVLIVVISVLPIGVEVLRQRRRSRTAGVEGG